MQITDFRFPHPVLTNFTDDINDSINYETKINETKNEYLISLNFYLENPDMSKYIIDKLAVNVCEIECSGTLYRQVKRTFSNKLEFSISKKKLIGKVYFKCFMLF